MIKLETCVKTDWYNNITINFRPWFDSNLSNKYWFARVLYIGEYFGEYVKYVEIYKKRKWYDLFHLQEELRVAYCKTLESTWYCIDMDIAELLDTCPCVENIIVQKYGMMKTLHIV